MSTFTRWAVSALGLSLCSLIGCSGNSPLAPSTTGQPGAGESFEVAGPFQRANGIVEGAVSRGMLTVDANTMTASWEPLPLRSGEDNDSVFALPLNGFFKKSNYFVSGVRRDADSLNVSYKIIHPFATSEVSGRADLGFSGMVLFAIDTVSPGAFSWFTGDSDLIADPRWITNADGYYQFKGLLDDPDFNTNAWPYQVLVREYGPGRFDPRNGAQIDATGATGNYVAPKGWPPILFNYTWTGYGVLHQGQGVENTIDISLAMLQANGQLNMQTVLLAKYADPKSGIPGFEHRLPVPIAEGQADDVVTKFGYRMPHGALDVPFAEIISTSTGWSPNVASTATLRLKVTDWDARATETTFPSLKDDPDGTSVGQGESGIPELALCIPNVLGSRSTVVDLPNAPTDDDSAYDGDVGVDSGRENDALFFEIDVPKPAGTGQSTGEFLAWLRVSDVEGDGQAGYLTPLLYDLTPITGEFPSPVTYHPFLVRMNPPCPPATGVGWAYAFGAENDTDSGAWGVGVDSAGNVYACGEFDADTDFGGGIRTAPDGPDWWLVKMSPTGSYLWDKVWNGTDNDELRDMVIDSQDRIWLGGRHSGTIDLGGGPLTAVSDDDLLLARFDSDGDHEFSAQFGETQFTNFRQLAVGPSDEILLTGYCYGRIDFGGGPHNTSGGEDIVVANFNPNGTLKWSKMFGGSGPDYGYSVSVASTGDVYVTGSFQGSVNFGPSTEVSAGSDDIYLLKLAEADGAPQWAQSYGSTGYDRGLRVVTYGANRVTVGGEHLGLLDMGGGTLPGTGTGFDVFLAQYNATGTHRWSQNITNDTFDGARLQDLKASTDGDLIFAGYAMGPVSMGGPLLDIDNSDDGLLTRLTGEGIWVWDGQIAGINGQSVKAVAWDGLTGLVHGGFVGGGTIDADPSCAVGEIPVDFGSDHYVSRMTADGGW